MALGERVGRAAEWGGRDPVGLSKGGGAHVFAHPGSGACWPGATAEISTLTRPTEKKRLSDRRLAAVGQRTRRDPIHARGSVRSMSLADFDILCHTL